MSDLTYGDQIREAREAMGLTRNALAKISDVNEKTILCIEGSHSNARRETKLKLEKHLSLAITLQNAPEPLNVDGPHRWANEWVAELRRVREESGVTAVAVANKAGTSVGHLYAIESGKRIPRLDVAMALSDAVGIVIEW